MEIAHDRRDRCIDELVETEIKFVGCLRGVERRFISSALLDNADAIFGNIPQLLTIHSRLCAYLCVATGRNAELQHLGWDHPRQRLLALALGLHPRLGEESLVQQLGADLIARIGEEMLRDTRTSVAAVLIDHLTAPATVDAYSLYSQSIESALQQLICMPAAKRALLQPDLEASEAVDHPGERTAFQLPVDALLTYPISRLPRYRALLAEVLRHTPPAHPEHDVTRRASELLEQAERTIYTRVREADAQRPADALAHASRHASRVRWWSAGASARASAGVGAAASASAFVGMGRRVERVLRRVRSVLGRSRQIWSPRPNPP
jgi:hypothetical protein